MELVVGTTWDSKVTSLMNEKKVYDAIRVFNSSVSRILAKAEKDSPPTEIESTVQRFLVELARIGHIHEIGRVLEAYLKNIEKLGLSAKYLLILTVFSPQLANDIAKAKIFEKLFRFFYDDNESRLKPDAFDKLILEFLQWVFAIDSRAVPAETIFEVLLLIVSNLISGNEYEKTHNFLTHEKIAVFLSRNDRNKVLCSIVDSHLLLLMEKFQESVQLVHRLRERYEATKTDRLFSAGASIVLAVRAEDTDWFLESKTDVATHVGGRPVLQKIELHLLNEIQTKFFPESNKNRALGFF